jgi:hypothetical protein
MIHFAYSTGTACGDRVHVLGSAHTTDDPAAVTCDCCIRRIRRWPCLIDGDECFRRHGPDSPCQHGMEPPADGTVACLHCGSSFRARLAEYVAAVETALMQTEVGRNASPRYASRLHDAGDALKRECANAPRQPEPEAGDRLHADVGQEVGL